MIMLLTVKAYYHDGKIDMKELPEGLKESKVLITFLDKEDKDEIPVIKWDELEDKASTVDKWVGVLSDINITDVRKARKKHIESKHT